MKENNKSLAFNPIKEEKDGIRARRMIWTTDALNKAIKGLEDGKKLVANPFYENNIKLLKGDLVFSRTPEEIEEWKRCAQDIIYFANKYAKLMTPEGIKHITLRDYQERYLEHLMKNRLSIYLACRQCSKCVTFTNTIDCKIDLESLHIDGKLKKYIKQNYYNIENNSFNIPLFEVYNFFDKSLLWKIKYELYKILYKLILWKIEKEDKNVKDIKK